MTYLSPSFSLGPLFIFLPFFYWGSFCAVKVGSFPGNVLWYSWNFVLGAMACIPSGWGWQSSFSARSLACNLVTPLTANPALRASYYSKINIFNQLPLHGTEPVMLAHLTRRIPVIADNERNVFSMLNSKTRQMAHSCSPDAASAYTSQRRGAVGPYSHAYSTWHMSEIGQMSFVILLGCADHPLGIYPYALGPQGDPLLRTLAHFPRHPWVLDWTPGVRLLYRLSRRFFFANATQCTPGTGWSIDRPVKTDIATTLRKVVDCAFASAILDWCLETLSGGRTI